MLTVAVLAVAGLVRPDTAAAAGGPYVVDDAEIADPGECQIDAWASFGRSGDRILVAAPSCTFQAIPWVEFGLAVERARGDGEWATVVAPGLKTSIVPVDRFGVGIGLSAAFAYDLTDSTVDGGEGTALFTVEPTEGVLLNLNLGYKRNQIDRRHYVVWGVGGVFEPVDNVGFIAEIFGRHTGRAGYQAGIRPTLLDGQLDLDFVVGRNLTDRAATWITAGATLRF
ncbi:MAG: hypothetical protein ACK4QW_15635 [Alphaproteobacteria bacterium]